MTRQRETPVNLEATLTTTVFPAMYAAPGYAETIIRETLNLFTFTPFT
ncbi:MAG: hypothetical protein AB2792_14620 [Candidatus Thiodiazotropha sp.]